MWSFQLRCWSTINAMGFGFIHSSTTSLHKISSLWGIRFFLVEHYHLSLVYIKGRFIWIQPWCNFGNSVLMIWIASSIESLWTYTVVSSAKSTSDRIVLGLTMSLMWSETDVVQELIPGEHLYFNLSCRGMGLIIREKVFSGRKVSRYPF